jgi:RNA-directed DNA polymerase
MPDPLLVSALARSFLAGEPIVEEIVARATRTLGRSWRWLKPLARRYLQTLTDGTRPRHRDVVRFLLHDQNFRNACSKYSSQLRVQQWLPEPQQMQPVAAAEQWDVPAIESAGALAEWLGLTPGELDWFADLKALGYKNNHHPQLKHYHYRALSKPSGSMRIIEAPKPRLKKLQRQILAGILDKIPPHRAAHGFVRDRSIKTFTAPHIAQRVVIRMDLRDFFPSFGAARIQSCFRTIGYPESVANPLAGICTNATPRSVWAECSRDFDAIELHEAPLLYSKPHLPQGAPTSPALANMCTYRADCRLTGLATSVDSEYSRYADDLAFSGGSALAERAEQFAIHAAAILMEEGFTVHHRKTRIMRQGVRQHLAGLVTNQRMNVMRPDFDSLKATLTNCVRHGPESQNRAAHPAFRSHLQGRVAFVEAINPDKGKRLRAIFDGIQWQQESGAAGSLR